MEEIPPQVLQALTELLRPIMERTIREELVAGLLPLQRDMTALAGDVGHLAQLGGVHHAAIRVLQGYSHASLPDVYERAENGNFSGLITEMRNALRAGPPPPPHAMYFPGHPHQVASTVVTPLPTSAAPAPPPPPSWSHHGASGSQAPPQPPAPTASTGNPFLALLQSATREATRRAHTNMRDAPPFPVKEYYVKRVHQRYLEDMRRFVLGIMADTNIGEAEAIAAVFKKVPVAFQPPMARLSAPHTMDAFENMITTHSAFASGEFYTHLDAFALQGEDESVLDTIVRFMSEVVDKSKGFPPLEDRLNFHHRRTVFGNTAADTFHRLHIFWSYVTKIFDSSIRQEIAKSLSLKDVRILDDGHQIDWSDRDVWKAWCDEYGKDHMWSLHMALGRGTSSSGASHGPSASAAPADMCVVGVSL